MEEVSKKLAFLLRHCTGPQFVDVRGGWASVDAILRELKIGRDALDEIVSTDSKGRYSYSADGTKIRANQGHSIPGVEIDMERPTAPEFLYHGTATRFLNDIFRMGLKPMGRQWVHLSSDAETALAVGRRHGSPVVLRIHAQRFVEDGHDLFRSANGVWQAKGVPPEYFEIEN